MTRAIVPGPGKAAEIAIHAAPYFHPRLEHGGHDGEALSELSEDASGGS